MNILIISLFLSVWVIDNGQHLVNANCSPCPPIPKHYEELGCKPANPTQFECCPTAFDCPDFTTYDRNVCYFNSTPTETIPNFDCFIGCSCSPATEKKEAKFKCKVIVCPKAMNYNRDCIYQQELDRCCESNTICNKEEIEQLPTCMYFGKKYYKGELITPVRPSEKCYKCLCDESFDNTTIAQYNNNCKPKNCGIEIRKLGMIKQNCVPVYKEGACCPIEYRCPNDEDAYENPNERVEPKEDEKYTCKYGKLHLKKYESFLVPEKCLSCACSIPPLVSCSKRTDDNC